MFRTVSPNGDVEHWAANDPGMTPEQQEELKGQAWGIEQYHRGLKQCCGVEKRQARKAQSQRSHIGMAIQAFVRLEIQRLRSGVSWYEAAAGIVRSAIRHYLVQPLYSLKSNCVTPSLKPVPMRRRLPLALGRSSPSSRALSAISDSEIGQNPSLDKHISFDDFQHSSGGFGPV